MTERAQNANETRSRKQPTALSPAERLRVVEEGTQETGSVPPFDKLLSASLRAVSPSVPRGPQEPRGDSRTVERLPDPARPLQAQEPDVLFAMGLFGEARGESEAGQRAVAQVIVNRARFPHRVFGSRPGREFAENLRRVLLKPRQFSCFLPSDPNYPKLFRPLDYEPRSVWERCWRCAQQALAGRDQPDRLTANSDHYYDDSRPAPSWADPAKRTVTMGRLVFYRLYLPAPAGTPHDAASSVGGSPATGLPEPPSQRPSDVLPGSGSAGRGERKASLAPSGTVPRACPNMSLPPSPHPGGRTAGQSTSRWRMRGGGLSSLLAEGGKSSGGGLARAWRVFCGWCEEGYGRRLDSPGFGGR